MAKSCGSCTLCCELIAVRELGKKQFEDCRHRRGPPFAMAGCGIYQTRPPSCAAWSCLWLRSDPVDWPEAERPDRVGFVVDELVDLIRINGVETPAAQIWVQRGHEDAWENDPAHAIILALINKGLAVLWRLAPGGHAITFCKTADGRLGRSAPTPYSLTLGSEAERSLRVAEIAAARQSTQAGNKQKQRQQQHRNPREPTARPGISGDRMHRKQR